MGVPRFPYGKGREGKLNEENSLESCLGGTTGRSIKNLSPVREVHLDDSQMAREKQDMTQMHTSS